MISNSKRLAVATILGAALVATTGCAGHGVPAHGGGMRFYWEQKIIEQATQDCLEGIGLTHLAGKKVRLIIHAIGHEGGGTVPKAPGLLEIGAATAVAGPVGLGGSVIESQAQSASNDYQPYAFANARDIEYLKGAIIFKLAASGVTVCDAGNADLCAGTLQVIVPVFGTDKWSHGFVMLRKERLTASVKMAMMFVDAAGKPNLVDTHEAAATYGESFVFGVQWDEPSVRPGTK